ncbi:MAG: hypothetical protein QG622_2928 [Actinomycetota bacterium]|nr:hypothetical protein [Actinomycetota bacterium]
MIPDSLTTTTLGVDDLAADDDLPGRIRLKQVGWVLAAAFDQDPVTRWLVTEPSRYREAMIRFFTAIAEDALAGGAVDAVVDGAGNPLAAALWFDLTASRPDPAGSGDHRWEEVFGPDAPRWHLLDGLMTRTHLEEPHWYLMALGVHPDIQGYGLGSRLLTHGRHRLPGVAGYLEATTLRSRGLYARHGYGCLGEVHTPDGPPPMWRMLLPAG